MKRIFIVLLAICPLIAAAQEEATPKPLAPLNKWEIHLSTGITLHTSGGYKSNFTGLYFSGISLLRNVGNVQFGIGVPFNFSNKDSWEVLPQLIVNRTFNTKHVYFYIGGAAGYASRQNISSQYSHKYTDASSKGYVLGLQLGAVYKIGKHFAINTEIALRSSQYWNKIETLESGFAGFFYQTRSHQFFELSTTGSVGVRYRFN